MAMLANTPFSFSTASREQTIAFVGGTIALVAVFVSVAYLAFGRRMGRYLLSGLFVLAFGFLNAFGAENSEKTAVGLGEVCDKKLGPLCKSGLECNSSEPGKAGLCANATVPEKVVPTAPAHE